MLAVAGFSLPSPVMTPMFLDADGGLMAHDVDRSVRIWWLALAFALYPLGQIVGTPWLGRLSDQIGRKRVLVLSLVGVALGYLLMALAIDQRWLGVLLLSRFWEGVCNGNIAIAQALAADISTPQRKPRLFSLLNVALNMGWVVGPLMGGYLAEYGGDYAIPFVMAALLALVNLAAVAIGLPATGARPDPPRVRTGHYQLLRLPRLRLFFLLTLLSYGAVMLYFSFFNIWLVERFQMTPVGLAQAAVIISVPMMFGSWLAGRLAGRIRLAWLGVLGHGVMAVAMVSFIVPDQLLGLYLLMAVAGIGITIGELATSVAISDHAPRQRQGEAMGLYRALAMVSELLAALVGALLIIPGTEWVYVGASVLALICTLIFLKLVRTAGAYGSESLPSAGVDRSAGTSRSE